MNIAKQPIQLGRLENFLEKNQRRIILLSLLISLIFSFLLFDIKVSQGGDDSGYIQRAWDFTTKNKFPFYQGPFYPLVLAIPVSIIGLNLLVLKSLSIFFILGNLWFTYLIFRKRVPHIILFSLILFLTINDYIQYYASQTYTEAFFLFIQSISLYYVVKIVDSNTIGKTGGNKKIKPLRFLSIGICFTLLTMTKTVAIVSILPIILFFIFYKHYKYAFYTLISFIICKSFVELLINLFYKGNSNQWKQMFLKNIYHPEFGNESFSGIAKRFYNNTEYFISVSLCKILHLREALAIKSIGILALILLISLVSFTIFSYKRNCYIFLFGLYFFTLTSSIFLGINEDNKQDRLVLIIVPYAFILLTYGLYEMALKYFILRISFLLSVVILLSVNLYSTVKSSAMNITNINKNIDGDLYYGYTEDWVNFLKMSTYCSDSLGKKSFVASRKASISFIYGKGKEFYAINSVFSTDPDIILAKFKANKVTHIIVPSLRLNPKKNTGLVINTTSNLLYPIYQKYPQKLAFVKQIGKNEPTYLYRIKY